MQAIFMARGPAFNDEVQINSINNVDIYHIACRILKLQPNQYATAGSLVNLTSVFRTVENISTTETPTTPYNNGCGLFSTSSLSVLLMFFLLFFSFYTKF
jgi:hypothetical protein